MQLSDRVIIGRALKLGEQKMPLTANQANQAQKLLRWMARDRERLLKLSEWRRDQMVHLSEVVMDGPE